MSIVNLGLSPEKRPVLAAALGFTIRGDGLCGEGAWAGATRPLADPICDLDPQEPAHVNPTQCGISFR
jgi:hypothetical protein